MTRTQQAEKPESWGYVGDIAAVVESLRDLNRFMDTPRPIRIDCPHCDGGRTVFHMYWSAVLCSDCKGEIPNPGVV